LNDNHHSKTRLHRPLDRSAPFTGMFSGEHPERLATTKDSPIAALLEAVGHSRDCIIRMRSGLVVSCSCTAPARSPGDAAMAIGLAIRFARIGAAHGLPVPRGVLKLLVELVDAGDPAAAVVWKWLVARGQVSTRARLRPKLRLIRGEVR